MLSETNWSEQLKTLSADKEKMYQLFGMELAKPGVVK
jgi:hypothetical protein